MADQRNRSWVAAAFTLPLAACASQVTMPPQTVRRRPAEFPDRYYDSLSAQGSPVFRVDPDRSIVTIEVRRGGPLAHLGHNHIVVSHDLGGYIAPDEGRADLHVPLDRLVIDDPVLRAQAGMDTHPSATDIGGTQRNMLEALLETSRFPDALIAVKADLAIGTTLQPMVDLGLHGTTRRVDAPLNVRWVGQEMEVTGILAIDQSQFGIVPLSVLGGAIAVQDRVKITFRIRATQITL